MVKNVIICSNVTYWMPAGSKKLTLPQLIREVLEADQSSEQKIADRTKGKLTQSNINDLKNSRVKSENASIFKLYWLAKGLNRKPLEVFAIALGVSLKDLGIKDAALEISSESEHLLNQLPTNRRKDVLRIASLFLEDAKPDLSEKPISSAKTTESKEITIPPENVFDEERDLEPDDIVSLEDLKKSKVRKKSKT